MLSQEQLQRRKIGASDASAIMGLSPWTTPYQLWEQKVSGVGVKENNAMKRGSALEPQALRSFESLMGVKLESQVFVTHRDHHFMTATLDGINEEKKILVEIKCPNAKTHSLASSGKQIPEHYMPQLQHQMEVTGYDMMYYYSFDGYEGAVVEVQKDKKYIKSLVNAEADFWRRVMEWDPPELTDRDYQPMGKDKNWIMVSDRFKKVSQDIKSLQSEEKELRKALISLSRNKNSIGNGLKIKKSQVEGAVNYSEIPELLGVDLSKYRKESFEKWIFYVE